MRRFPADDEYPESSGAECTDCKSYGVVEVVDVVELYWHEGKVGCTEAYVVGRSVMYGPCSEDVVVVGNVVVGVV